MTKDKKSIWIINQFLTTPELSNEDGRHSSLVEEFIKNGYDVTLITSSFSHAPYRHNKFRGLYQLREGKFRTILLKGINHNYSAGIWRLINLFLFSILLLFIPYKKLPKPDIIIVSSFSLIPILNAFFQFKKRYKKVKIIFEIRDIWPLTAIEVGGYSKNNLFIKFLSWVEDLGYKKSDYIVSLLKDANVHISKKINNTNFNYAWIPNGYKINNLVSPDHLPKEITDKIPNDKKFVIGYSGAIGLANSLKYIIQSVIDLENEDFVLCILGDGVNKEKLQKLSNGHNNIVFLDRVNKNKVQDFLSRCDLLYVGLDSLPIFEYGISPNKLFDYMYASKPILLAAPNEGFIYEANCGEVVRAENIDDIKSKLRYFKKLKTEERAEIGQNGYDFLIERLTYEKLAVDYIKIFEELTSK